MRNTKPYCRFVLLLAFILLTGNVLATENNPKPFSYDEEWSKVDQFAKEDRPESALKEVEVILKQAERDHNTVQYIKASIRSMAFILRIEPDKAPAQIARFDSLIGKAANEPDKALLQSMTAELYQMYYTHNRYDINMRTEVIGLNPGDLTEWTRNQFLDKIGNLLADSMQNETLLQQTDINLYKTLLTTGESESPDVKSTLFDFLARRKIELLKNLRNWPYTAVMTDQYKALFLPSERFVQMKLDTTDVSDINKTIVETFQQWLRFREKDGNAAALIQTDLNRLNTCLELTETDNFRSNSENSIPLTTIQEAYFNALHGLALRFRNVEKVVDVLGVEALFYRNHFNSDENIQRLYYRKAYDICTDAIMRFPKSKDLGLLKNVQAQITQKRISIDCNEVVKPKMYLEVMMSTRNLEEVELDVYRINATAQQYLTHSRSNNALFPNRTLIEKRLIKINKDPNFYATRDTFEIKTGDYGIYEFMLGEQGKPDNVVRGTFVVSDLAYMVQNNAATQIYVVDRVTGKPKAKVGINIFTQDFTQPKYSIKEYIKNALTDNTGLYVFKSNGDHQNIHLFFENGADKYLSSQHYSFRYNGGREGTKSMRINVFTDRSLYRPGQTVYFKGIAYYSNKDRQEVAAGEYFEVKLMDANSKQVAVRTLRINEFGSFADSFVLPEGGLNGAFSIRVNQTRTTIWVEEYKRPSFEVTMERPKAEVHFGETVTMEGKVTAYAGYPVSDAKVTYRVVRYMHYRWHLIMPQKDVSNGSTMTAADGSFNVTFQPEKNSSLTQDQYYTYKVSATVTDQKGETQNGEKTISVGDKSLFIVTNLANGSKIDKLKDSDIEIQVETLNGEQVKAEVRYELYRLKPNDDYAENNTQSVSAECESLQLSGTFLTKEDTLKIDWRKLESGSYRMVLTTNDQLQQKVETSTDFILYSQNDKQPPVKSYEWFLKIKTDCAVGEKGLIKYGTSAEQVHVLYQIMKDDQVLESKWMTLSNEIRTIEIPYQSYYGDGVNVQFSFIKDEQLFVKSITIKQKVENRKLSPKLAVFRDKLQPGEKAEWTITVPEVSEQKKIAELLVYMYDASLDAIRPHSLWFNPAYQPVVPYSPSWNSTVSNQLQRSVIFDIHNYPVTEHDNKTLDWMGLSFNKTKYATGGFSVASVRGVEVADLADHQVIIEEKPVYGMRIGGIASNQLASVAKSKETINPVVRSNFNETAFFYPQLRTDEQGNVKISFTVPESLTRWNVNMLAHTKDLYSGITENQVVTQKELMVQLNLPRFVRRSDKLVLRASVVNLTDSVQTTNVKLELSNPENGKIIVLKDGLTRTVVLAAEETKHVEWEVTEFAPFQLVVCKVVASCESFSDGEQKYLPVLPDQVLITESLPMTVRANQTKTFTLENLLKNGSNVASKSLTIEFSPNPAWYAVQALPSLSVSENDNAFDYFTAYYVNSLAAHIANSNPKLAVVFDQWKRSGNNQQALLSNLEKNKELKSMLLEETPWVMAAQNETEQKKRIALLFDLNQEKQQNTLYWDKLMKLQQPDGGFSWFEGMPASRYVTQYILLNAARLNTLTKTQATVVDAPVLKAIAFIDNELSRDFEQLRKNNNTYKTTMNIGDMQWFYLHVRSEYPQVLIPDFAKEAVAYYTTQAQEYWQKATLYGKAATAVIAGRNQNKTLAAQILVSLKENAVKSDEMGMYWARNTAGYFWNQRPVMVQTMLLEAFAEIAKNAADLDEMKIWLLRQKQTQRWDSPLSTMDAIYALLHYGTDWISSSNEVSIQLGSTPVRTEQKEAGSGYVKQTYEGSDMTPQMACAKVELKGTSGFGWGALYWQYFQNLNLVQQSGNALTVSKKLFVEQLLQTGKVMCPIEKVVLKVGDKVITRLVVTVDRDMEYVALKDLRAACFEPVVQRSGYVWKENVGYYQTTKDASTQFFFSSLPKGSYVFEYEVWVNNAGEFTSGITTLQCQYAPEFSAHSGGERIVVSVRSMQ